MNATDIVGPLVSTRNLARVLGTPVADLYRLAEHADEHYRPFRKRQERAGRIKCRDIDNPKNQLKTIQRRIKQRLLDPLPVPPYVYGGVRGRSTQMNARMHVGRREVVTIDISNFFGTVTNRQVAGVWRRTYGAAGAALWLLARLTTFQGHLPQGAPSSTALANLALLPAAEQISVLCAERRLQFSVYVDDITVSGDYASTAIGAIANVLGKNGFRLARSKSRVMPSHTRQETTGHVVNRKVSNSRTRLRRARVLVLEAIRDEDHRKWRSAKGLVAHITSTAPNQGRWLAQMLEKNAYGERCEVHA